VEIRELGREELKRPGGTLPKINGQNRSKNLNSVLFNRVFKKCQIFFSKNGEKFLGDCPAATTIGNPWFCNQPWRRRRL
jgi:hypothetical protein